MKLQNVNLTVSNISMTFDSIKNELQEGGNINEFELFALIKIFEKNFKKVEPIIKDSIKKTLSEKGEKYAVAGHSISVKKGGKYYDYKNCPMWVKLNNELKALETRLRTEEVWDEDGVIQPKPVEKKRSSSLSFTKN